MWATRFKTDVYFLYFEIYFDMNFDTVHFDIDNFCFYTAANVVLNVTEPESKVYLY